MRGVYRTSNQLSLPGRVDGRGDNVGLIISICDSNFDRDKQRFLDEVVMVMPLDVGALMRGEKGGRRDMPRRSMC